MDTDWIEIPAGTYQVGLTGDEAVALARTSAEATRKHIEDDPDALHGLREHAEMEATSGNLQWLTRMLIGAWPAHPVELAAYRIARTPVTNAEYKRFMDTRRVSSPMGWRFPGGSAPDRPVIGVCWNDAAAYAAWAGARLPSEAEWERAARGEERRLFPWGDTYFPTGRLLDAESVHVRLKAGTIPGLESPAGCVDMVTRHWEWCSDAFGPYPGSDPAIFGELHALVKPGFRSRRGGQLEHIIASALSRDGSRSGFQYDTACIRLAASI